jgi:uncharacterized protein YjbJ (UPF0337 family)
MEMDAVHGERPPAQKGADMVENTSQVKGAAKVAAGAATGNKKMEQEGRVDRYVGDLKSAISDGSKKLESLATTAGDKAADAIASARGALLNLIDKVTA